LGSSWASYRRVPAGHAHSSHARLLWTARGRPTSWRRLSGRWMTRARRRHRAHTRGRAGKAVDSWSDRRRGGAAKSSSDRLRDGAARRTPAASSGGASPAKRLLPREPRQSGEPCGDRQQGSAANSSHDSRQDGAACHNPAASGGGAAPAELPHEAARQRKSDSPSGAQGDRL